MPFNIPFSDIQKVIEEVTKHYILVPIEQADTQTLFLNFKSYADRLCSLLREKNATCILKLDAALDALSERKKNREKRNVEGLNKV